MMRWWSVMWLVLPLAVCAQYPLVRSFIMLDGQQRMAVTCVAQDEQGLLILGTDHGLFRSDGERCDALLRTEKDPVTAICTDKEGVLAAFAGGAIMHCVNGHCDTLAYDVGFKVHVVIDLVVARDGALWMGTYGAGARIRKNGKLVSLTAASGLPDDHINAMCALDDGRVALATDQGIVIADPQGHSERLLGETSGAPDNLVLAMTFGPDGRIWAGGDRGGAFSFDPDVHDPDVMVVDTAWASGAVTSIAVSDGRVWVGTRAEGVVVYDLGERIARYAPSTVEQGAQGHVTSLALGQLGGVWWCDGTERVRRADRYVLRTPEHEGVDMRRITALASGPDGTIAFATRDGVFTHAGNFSDKDRMQGFVLPVDSTNQVVALHTDPRGNLWAGTFGAGVFRITRDGRTDHFSSANGGVDNNVMAISSHGDDVWFATFSGVYRWAYNGTGNSGRFHSIHIPGHGFTYDIRALRDGQVVVATDGSGIVSIPPGDNARTLKDASNERNTFYSLSVDSMGTAWAVGPGTGVCRITRDSVIPLASTGPPPMVDVYSITAFHNSLMVAGPGGLVGWDRNSGEINDLTNELDLLDLRSEINAACTDRQQNYWLSTERGLYRISIPAARLVEHVRTVITDVVQGGDRLDPMRPARLPPGQDFLLIRFTGLHYAAPQDLRFAYRLIGSDTTVRITRDHEVTLSKLVPGNYKFQVSAVADDGRYGQWSEFAFSIPRPWYRTPWAIGGWIVLAAIALVLVLRLRDARLRSRDRMEKDKARFQMEVLRSQVNPHFLFNSFNTLIELIEEDGAKAVEHVSELSDFFREILQVRDKELIPVAEELRLVNTYFSLERRRFGHRIALHVAVPEGTMTTMVPPLTVQLLVENALKHNRATEQEPLVVSIVADDRSLTVSNALRPRADQPISTGFGIASIRQRFMALSEDPVQVSRDNATFAVRIPLIHPEP